MTDPNAMAINIQCEKGRKKNSFGKKSKKWEIAFGIELKTTISAKILTTE